MKGGGDFYFWSVSKVSCLELKACLLNKNYLTDANLQLRSCTKNLKPDVMISDFILSLVWCRLVAFLVAIYVLLGEFSNTNYSF